MRFWKEEEQWKKWLHHSAAMIGGFFGAYLVLTRAGIFGNAQTLNLISLVLAICGANIYEVMLRLGVLILYVCGTALYVIVTEKKLCNEIALSLFLDAVALVILGCMPQHIDVIWTMYPIAFALSFQWNAFPGAYSYISSTIFSTNNTKQTTLAFTRYFLYKDPEDKKRGFFFLGTLCFFHIGVLWAYFSVKWLYEKGSFLGLLLIIPVALIAVSKKCALSKNHCIDC